MCFVAIKMGRRLPLTTGNWQPATANNSATSGFRNAPWSSLAYGVDYINLVDLTLEVPSTTFNLFRLFLLHAVPRFFQPGLVPESMPTGEFVFSQRSWLLPNFA